MSFKLFDRVQETTTTTGTGTISMGGAVTGYRAFSSVFTTLDTTHYVLSDGTNWEVGLGTLTTGTPWTLARTTILASSNAGAAVNFPGPTTNVWCDATAQQISVAPTFSGQITSTVATGTAPFVVASTTPVANLAVATATNVAGGATGSVVVQSSAGVTAPVLIGAANTVFTSNGTNPQWTIGRSALVTTSAAINTTAAYITPSFQIPANSIVAGDAFEIFIRGACTSTAANVSTFVLRFGTVGTTADAAILSPTVTANAAGTGVPFTMRIVCTFRTNGATGTLMAAAQLDNSSATAGIANASISMTVLTTAATVNTTVANFLGVSYSTAAATTTSTFYDAIVRRIY